MRRIVPPLRVEVVPSRLWLGWVVSAALALGVLLPLHVSPLALLPLPWLVWLALRADGRLGGDAPSRFTFDPASGRAWLDDEDGLPIRVRDDSAAWPWLIVLRFEAGGRRRSRLFLPDSAPADDQRRLRMFLRWAPVPE